MSDGMGSSEWANDEHRVGAETCARVEVCRACGAPIVWASTVHGRAMPIDADPDPDGNIELVADAKGRTVAHVHHDGQASLFGDVQRWMPHFATCPNWEAP